MKTVATISRLRKELALRRGTVGFVPTMGFFHEGHLTLMRRAKKENGTCVVSLFVNPIQFGPKEDLARYPRDLVRDRGLAAGAGADILFVPDVDEMYGGADRSALTMIVPPELLTSGLCGASRKDHFTGVATVVAKLMNIVRPDAMYLGQKDAQQVAVIKRMAADLDFSGKIVVCPTVREPDGLAMSSRNSYLSPSERLLAPALYRALKEARREILRGERDARKIISVIKKLLPEAGSASIDYISVVDTTDLRSLVRLENEVLIALAVKFPSARLIDNVVVKVPKK